MELFLELMTFPFLQRAILSGVCIAILLSLLGVFATLRNMAFFSEGIAHASLAGIAIAVLVGWAPLPLALLWAVCLSVLLFFAQKKDLLSSDTLIGIAFTSSLALGIVLMSFTKGYQSELLSFLFGSILTTNTMDVVLTFLATGVVLAWLIPSMRALTFSSLAPDLARVRGVHVDRHVFVFYIALSVATVLGVKLLGIILVSALLIIPAASARLITKTFVSYALVSVLAAIGAVLFGLAFSLIFDLPSGATIVLVSTVGVFLSWIFSLTR